MNRSVIATLTTLAIWGLVLPAQAQRFGNSSLEFYDQGLSRLEQEVQRLQKQEATSQPPALIILPAVNSTEGNPPPTAQPSPVPSQVSPQSPVPSVAPSQPTSEGGATR